MKVEIASALRKTISRRTGPAGKNGRTRGQSAVELAMLLPLLVLLFSTVIEGGLAINGWIRVNTAARDATRFAVDAGRDADIQTLVLNKLKGIDFGSSPSITGSLQLDIYVIRGTTDGSGNISSTQWPNSGVGPAITHPYGSRSGGPNIQRTSIQSRLASQGSGPSQNVKFTIVEVDYQYTPLLATLISPGTRLPMSSYAIVQQY
jgi:hypothetical protein